MFPTLSIGKLSVQTPGLILLLGVWLGLTLSEHLASRYKVPGDVLYNLAFTAFLAGLLGARLSYIVSAPRIFLQNPLRLFSLNPLLLDLFGGLIIGLLAAMIYASNHDLLHWKTLDALTPLAAVFNLALGISHLASGKAYGLKTDLPWGMELWNATRHPTQIYEILAALMILGFVWYKGNPAVLTEGRTFAMFLTLSSASHLVIAGFRRSSEILLGGVRMEQAAAYLTLALSLWIWGKTLSQKDRHP